MVRMRSSTIVAVPLVVILLLGLQGCTGLFRPPDEPTTGESKDVASSSLSAALTTPPSLRKNADVITELRARFGILKDEVTDNELNYFLNNSDHRKFAEAMIRQHYLGQRVNAFVFEYDSWSSKDSDFARGFYRDLAVGGLLDLMVKVSQKLGLLEFATWMKLYTTTLSSLLKIAKGVEALCKFAAVVAGSGQTREVLAIYINDRESGKSARAAADAVFNDFGLVLNLLVGSQKWYRKLNEDQRKELGSLYLEERYLSWRLGTKKGLQDGVKAYIVAQTRFDFSLYLKSYAGTVLQGGTVFLEIEARKLTGLDSLVQFTVTDLPAGVTATPSAWSWSLGPKKTTRVELRVGAGVALGFYRIEIRGTGGGTTQSRSYELSVVSRADPTPPTVPTNLTARADSPTQINLTWSPSTDNQGVAGYRIFRGGSFLASVESTVYSDTGLTPQTTYCYRVSAKDVVGNESAPSSATCATTPRENRPPVIDTLAARPVTVLPGGQSRISLWAFDPDGDPLTFAWTTDGGSLSATTGPGDKIWTAPVATGVYGITVTVSDGQPGRVPVSRSVYVEVAQMSGCTVYVNPDEGRSLQQVIDAAPAGAVVCLGAGEFHLASWYLEAPLTITKPLTLRGQGAEATKIISQSSRWNVITVDTPYGDVRIADLTIQGYQCNPDWGNSVVAVFAANRLVIENCTIFRDCTPSPCYGWFGIGPIYGIHATEVAVETIIRGCTVSGCAVGIAVGGAQTVTIEDCVITGTGGPAEMCGKRGIWVTDTTSGVPDVTIRRCTVSGFVIGIFLAGQAQVVIEDNQVLRNLSLGIALWERPCIDPGDDRVFTGLVTGRRNRIPGPGEIDGNGVAVCPSDLSFLVTSTGGTLDRRR